MRSQSCFESLMRFYQHSTAALKIQLLDIKKKLIMKIDTLRECPNIILTDTLWRLSESKDREWVMAS